jgi:hypothetical protein
VRLEKSVEKESAVVAELNKEKASSKRDSGEKSSCL